MTSRWGDPWRVAVQVLGLALLIATPAAGLVAGGPPTSAHAPYLALGINGTDPPTSSLGAQGGASVPATLTILPDGYDLSSDLLGTTVSAVAHELPSETSVLNATSSTVLVWPGATAGDRVDVLNDTIVDASGTKLKWGHPNTNLTQFIALCRAIDCTAIMQVPGEIDDPSFAAAEVNYTEKTLGFTPAYWEVGNEPELWKHWDVPWYQWNQPAQTGSARITPGEYAWELHNYTMAMRTADPNIRILGLAGTGRAQRTLPLEDWVNITVAVDGPLLAGIAFHEYTGGRSGTPSLTAFYGDAAPSSAYGLVGRVDVVRQAVQGTLNTTCPTCAQLPIFVTELGSALSHFSYANDSRGFAGGLSMAASALEGADLNLSNLDVYSTELGTSNSWFNEEGQARPDYTVFAQLLTHLGGYAYPTQLVPPPGSPYSGSNTTLDENLYALATRASALGGRSDLLLLNDNLTTNVTLSPDLPGIGSGVPVELWEWSGVTKFSASNGTTWVEPSTPQPVETYFPGGLPSTWTLPSQTLAVFEALPTAGSSVDFEETGLPSGARWFLPVDGRMYETTATNFSVLLPEGTASLSPVAIPLPLGSLYPNPRERLEDFPPSLVSVVGGSQQVLVPFAQQWSLTVHVLPSTFDGTVPNDGWVNASTTTILTGSPRPGFVVRSWVGHGHGSFSGLGPVAKVDAEGSLVENVTFAPGYAALFEESGLPTGALWGVTIDKVTLTSSTSELDFPLLNGSYRFEVQSVPGYSATPASANFEVNGAAVDLVLLFGPIEPLFTVRWQESGLPVGTAWSVNVDGIVYPSYDTSDSVQLPNGTHVYELPVVDGLVPSILQATVSVQGAEIVVPVVYAPYAYPIELNASGLPAGTPWVFRVGGTSLKISSDSTELTEPNGTYDWTAEAPGGYVATPDNGTLRLAGALVRVVVVFSPAPGATSPFGYPPIEETLVVALVAIVGLGALAVLLPPPVDPPSSTRRTPVGAASRPPARRAYGGLTPTDRPGPPRSP